MAGRAPLDGFRKLPWPLRWLAGLVAGLAALLLLLSLALAAASNRFLRPLVEEQATAAIPGEVRAASLEIGLLGTFVTVEGLEIRPAEPGAEPVIRIGRLHLVIRPIPLLFGRVVVKRVEIDEPFVRLVREESGELDLLRIVVPESPPVPEPAPPAAEPVPIRVEEVTLGAGRIEFVDRALPGAEPLTLELPALRLGNVVVLGEPDEDPARIQLEVAAEGARIELGGKLWLSDDGIDVDADLEVENLPLARARVYLPDLGWTELEGQLDVKLHYVHVSGETQTAEGSATLRGLRVGVPSLADPAFALERLDVALERLDLLGRALALGEVSVEGLRVFFDPGDPARLPLLPKGLPGTEEPPGDAPPEPPFAFRLASLTLDGAELVPLGEGQQPVTVRAELGALASDASEPASLEIELAQEQGTLALAGLLHLEPPGFRGTLEADDLALPPLLRAVLGEASERLAAGALSGEIRLAAGSLGAGETPAPGGDLHAEGSLALTGVEAKSDAAGSFVAKADSLALGELRLDVPGLIPPPAVAPGAAPAFAAPADAGSLRLAGTLSVAGLAARSGAGEPLAADLARFELRVKDLVAPQLLAPAPAEGAPPAPDAGAIRLSGGMTLKGVNVRSGKGDAFALELEAAAAGLQNVEVPAKGPVSAAVDELRLSAPTLRLTRTEAGIVLPGTPQADAKPAAPSAPGADAPKSSGAKSAPDEAAFRLELARFSLEKGSVRFADRSVKPFYQGEVAAITASARNVAYPALRAEDVSVKLDAPGPAPFWLLASYTPPKSWFELELARLPLAPLNPYIESASGYVVNEGELSLYSKGSLTDGKVAASNWIKLFDPGISGGGERSPLEAATGVPVSLAVSLLKDPAGDIGLSIPIEYDESGTSVGVGRIIGSAVTQVLIGALASPLKLLGAVVDAGGRVKDPTPQPIGFLPGRAELAGSGIERIAVLAKLMATRPGLDVALRGETAGADGQFAREAALLEALDSGEGLPAAAEGLGLALQRRRVRSLLEARLDGSPEAADAEDTQALDAWVAAMKLPEDAMGALARARAAKVRTVLESEHGIAAARVQLAEPGPPGGSPEPAVGIQLEP